MHSIDASEDDVHQSAEMLVARYGAEALNHLRQALPMLQLIAGIGIVRRRPWSDQAQEWERAVEQVVAQVEDTDLRADTAEPKKLTTEDTIACAAREHKTLVLHVQRIDGEREDVEVEPYSIKQWRSHPTLFCWNVAHGHMERIPLHRILYCKGEGRTFEPRYDIEF